MSEYWPKVTHIDHEHGWTESREHPNGFWEHILFDADDNVTAYMNAHGMVWVKPDKEDT